MLRHWKCDICVIWQNDNGTFCSLSCYILLSRNCVALCSKWALFRLGRGLRHRSPLHVGFFSFFKWFGIIQSLIFNTCNSCNHLALFRNFSTLHPLSSPVEKLRFSWIMEYKCLKSVYFLCFGWNLIYFWHWMTADPCKGILENETHKIRSSVPTSINYLSYHSLLGLL